MAPENVDDFAIVGLEDPVFCPACSAVGGAYDVAYLCIPTLLPTLPPSVPSLPLRR